MAIFKTAYDLTAKNEGGYANDHRDLGGETYKGISRKNWPTWEGWKIIDAIPSVLKIHNATFNSAELDTLVRKFYLVNFWQTYFIDQIKSQNVANFVYDFIVNSGGAVKVIQKVLVKIRPIDVDGIIGQQTITAINSIHEDLLLPALVEARTQYLQGGVVAGWLDPAFLDGIIKRAESYLPSKKFQSA